MKILKRASQTFALLLPLTSLAQAGGEKGNGGGAFVCRNAAHRIFSAQLIDLYEAKAQYGLSVKQDARLTVDEQIDLAAFRIQSASNEFYIKLAPHLDQVRRILRVVPNAKLENTSDFDVLVSPKTCVGGKVRFEQLANYTDEGQLIVDEEIWKALAPTDRAALYVHEAIYSYLRQEDRVVTSKRARQITGHAFGNPSKSAFKLLLDTAILTGHYKCQGTIYSEVDIGSEPPTLGDIQPVYLLKTNLCALEFLGCGMTWYHDLRMKEAAPNEYQGSVTAMIKDYPAIKNLDGGRGSVRRLADGTLNVEMSWAGPATRSDGTFDRGQMQLSFQEPRWWYTREFTGCVRTGPAQKN